MSLLGSTRCALSPQPDSHQTSLDETTLRYSRGSNSTNRAVLKILELSNLPPARGVKPGCHSCQLLRCFANPPRGSNCGSRCFRECSKLA
jgi:hypothetical protein